MKAILFALVTASTSAFASPNVATAEPHAIDRTEVRALQALDRANAAVAATRKQWDLAVAGDHPVPAGLWAKRHFTALQARKAAEQRVAAVGHTAATARAER